MSKKEACDFKKGIDCLYTLPVPGPSVAAKVTNSDEKNTSNSVPKEYCAQL